MMGSSRHSSASSRCQLAAHALRKTIASKTRCAIVSRGITAQCLRVVAIPFTSSECLAVAKTGLRTSATRERRPRHPNRDNVVAPGRQFSPLHSDYFRHGSCYIPSNRRPGGCYAQRSTRGVSTRVPCILWRAPPRLLCGPASTTARVSPLPSPRLQPFGPLQLFSRCASLHPTPPSRPLLACTPNRARPLPTVLRGAEAARLLKGEEKGACP